MNKPPTTIANAVVVQVMLNWYSGGSSAGRGGLKFKYNESDLQWVDLDTVISTVTLSYNSNRNLYSLDLDHAKSLNEFIDKETQRFM
jgi:hypothetical protein